MRIKVLARGSRTGAADFEYRPGYVFVYDPSCDDYDWLVVYDEMPTESVGTIRRGREDLKCPRERTILATVEPVSIKSYSRSYTRQFGHLLTNRPYAAEKHPCYHLGRGYYWWFIGREYREYGELALPPKSRQVSVISSSKRMRHTKHAARYDLAASLAEAIPGMEWFGHGVRPFGKKHEVLEPYRYHVTIENHIGAHHWSEKLADAFLAECLPFYAGDPLAGEIFPEESFIPIPIDDPAASERIIREAIAAGEYEKRREAVLKAKELILTRYNFWAQVIDVIESSADQVVPADWESRRDAIFARKTLRRRNPLAALEDAWLHAKAYAGFRGIG